MLIEKGKVIENNKRLNLWTHMYTVGLDADAFVSRLEEISPRLLIFNILILKINLLISSQGGIIPANFKL
jgi:hypothetical protein